MESIKSEKTTPPGFILPVMESFYTLQGEGFHQGKAAYFVRLGGCDVGCVWCDVKESWEEDNHPKLSVEDIRKMILETPVETVVITGGEPLMHPLQELTTQLREAGLKTHLETSGAHPLSGSWDWVCLSPKKFRAPLEEVVSRADELKVVIYHSSDFEWAEKWAALVKTGCKLYLQPEWGKRETVVPMIVSYIKQFPQWELSLQIHKYIDVP